MKYTQLFTVCDDRSSKILLSLPVGCKITVTPKAHENMSRRFKKLCALRKITYEIIPGGIATEEYYDGWRR